MFVRARSLLVVLPILAALITGCGDITESTNAGDGVSPISYKHFSDPCKEARFYSKQMQAFMKREEEPPGTGKLIRKYENSGERCEFKIGIGPAVEARVNELLEAQVSLESAACAIREGDQHFSCLVDNNHGSAKVLVKVSASYDQISVMSCEARKPIGGLDPCEGIGSDDRRG